ncbi:MAG: NYN domain-containing protein [Cyanobacteria bacterium J083]|nr:MAG: NYN domain-containing protein [Cyanobacteria bacterium J083]
MAVSSSPVLLMVDGYNVIGAWSDLAQIRDRDGLEFARQDLIAALINYAAIEGYKTEIVFDAHYQNTPGRSEIITPDVSVYYTAYAQTADTYIEKACAGFFSGNPTNLSRLIVATSDQAQKLTAIGYGAQWVSAQKLSAQVEQAKKRSQRQQRSRQRSRGRFLFNSLDEEAQKRLLEWRKKGQL